MIGTRSAARCSADMTAGCGKTRPLSSWYGSIGRYPRMCGASISLWCERSAVPSDRAKAGLQLERAQQRHKFTLPPGLGLAENALHMIAYRPKSEPQTLRDCRQA